MYNTQSPDLVLVNDNKNTITLIELTVPFDTEQGAANAEERKMVRYASLMQELKGSFKANLITIEVGARGYITKENKSKISMWSKAFNAGKISAITATMSKLAPICQPCHLEWVPFSHLGS